MSAKYYAIITRDGVLKKGSAGYGIYTQYARACFWAKDDGDSVVELELPLNKEPLFIRKKVV